MGVFYHSAGDSLTMGLTNYQIINQFVITKRPPLIQKENTHPIWCATTVRLNPYQLLHCVGAFLYCREV